MARTPITTTIKFDGPFFKKDPVKTFLGNVHDLMEQMAAEGEADVVAQLKAGESGRYRLGGGVKPGRVSAHVVGRVESLVGKNWRYNAVVSVRNQGFTKKQATKLMAAASWLESQTHAFRRTAGRLRRAGKTVDLTRGLN